MLYSSYNSFKTNCMRHAMIIVLVDTFVSFLSCIIVFAYLGSWAAQRGMTDDSDFLTMVKPRSRAHSLQFAFVILPEVRGSQAENANLIKIRVIFQILSEMEGNSPQFWNFLLFTMLMSLSLDTIMGQVQTTLGSIYDQFPRYRRFPKLVAVSLSAVGCLGGVR